MKSEIKIRLCAALALLYLGTVVLSAGNNALVQYASFYLGNSPVSYADYHNNSYAPKKNTSIKRHVTLIFFKLSDLSAHQATGFNQTRALFRGINFSFIFQNRSFCPETAVLSLRAPPRI